MIEGGRLYKLDSNPLEQVKLKDRVKGEVYYNTEGHGIRWISEDEYERIQVSPLRKGYLITELDPLNLKMFWTLRENDPFFNDEKNVNPYLDDEED